jgi:hypothetical protein
MLLIHSKLRPSDPGRMNIRLELRETREMGHFVTKLGVLAGCFHRYKACHLS